MFVSYFPYPTGNRAATSFGPSLHLLSLLCSDFSLQLTLWLFSFYYDALQPNRNSHHFETYLQEEKNKCGFAIWDDQFLKKKCVRRLAVELDKIRQDKTRQEIRRDEKDILLPSVHSTYTHTWLIWSKALPSCMEYLCDTAWWFRARNCIWDALPPIEKENVTY